MDTGRLPIEEPPRFMGQSGTEHFKWGFQWYRPFGGTWGGGAFERTVYLVRRARS